MKTYIRLFIASAAFAALIAGAVYLIRTPKSEPKKEPVFNKKIVESPTPKEKPQETPPIPKETPKTPKKTLPFNFKAPDPSTYKKKGATDTKSSEKTEVGVLATNMEKAIYAIGEEQFEKAYSLLESAEPNLQRTFLLGLLDTFFNNHDEAKARLQEVINKEPDSINGEISQDILLAYSQHSTFEEAKPSYLDVLLAEIYLSNNYPDLAIEKARQATKTDPNYIDAWMVIGFGHVLNANYTEAVTALEKTTPSNNPDINYYLGLAYFYLEDHKKSNNYLDFALKNNHASPSSVKNLMTENYLQLEDYEQATLLYEEILSDSTQSVFTYVKPIWIYIDIMKAPEKAVALAKKAVKTHPGSAMSYNLQGWAYTANGELDRAIDFLTQAKKLDPNMAAIELNLGHAYKQKGEVELAKNHYNTALAMDPGGTIGERATEELAGL